MLPICFTKPYRKLLTFFSLSLAFECIFKLILSKKQKPSINNFDRNYVSVTENNQTVNKFVPLVERQDFKDTKVKQDDSKTVRFIEFLVAALMSAALHSLAYDFGDKYDEMDLSQHEYLVNDNLKTRGDMNDLDFLNYFFRKLFYHFMSKPGEDNFRYLIFK